MARKVFISFLGTTDYIEGYYVINGKKCAKSVRFVQQALVDAICKEGNWTEVDKIMVFCTKGAYEMNWVDGGQKSNPGAQGLESCLNRLQLKPEISVETIPEGFNEEQIWRIFDTVYRSLEDGDEIYFDMTHSFRAIPFFSMVLFNFAKVMKKTSVQAIYYGAFEALGPANIVREMPVENRIAEVINLQSVVQLQEYNSAAHDLLNYGRLKGLGKAIGSEEELSQHLRAIYNQVNTLDKYIQSNRMHDIAKGKNYIPSKGHKKNLLKSDLPIPIKLIVEKLWDKMDGFVPGDSNKNIEAAIDWAYQFEMLPQAYTIGQEYIISRLVDIYKSKIPYEDNINIRKYISSICGMSEGDVSKNNFDGILQGHDIINKELLNMPLIIGIRKWYIELANDRNDINHAKQGKKIDKLKKDFSKNYYSCLRLITEAENDIKV